MSYMSCDTYLTKLSIFFGQNVILLKLGWLSMTYDRFSLGDLSADSIK